MITVGIVAIGILVSYNLSKTYKKQFLQTLLYHQIFLYSFFLYGVWGRILLGQVLINLELSPAIINKASFFIPALGLPFLIICWYMLIKFFNEMNGFVLSKITTIGYFIFFGILITAGVWYVNTGNFKAIETPEIIIIRLLIVMNLISNIFIVVPSLFKKTHKSKIELNFPSAFILIYLTGILIYSAGLWFIKEHFLISSATILLMFAASAQLPVFTLILIKKIPAKELSGDLDFEGFCNKFEISKREAEIILEICAGKSNQAIANSLFITLQTVKDHAHRIFTKTGVKNRVHLTNLVREKITKK